MCQISVFLEGLSFRLKNEKFFDDQKRVSYRFTVFQLFAGSVCTCDVFGQSGLDAELFFEEVGWQREKQLGSAHALQGDRLQAQEASQRHLLHICQPLLQLQGRACPGHSKRRPIILPVIFAFHFIQVQLWNKLFGHYRKGFFNFENPRVKLEITYFRNSRDVVLPDIIQQAGNGPNRRHV